MQVALAARELARTHARYRAELARVDVTATNRDNATAYERACALRVGGVVWGDLSPTQFELVVPRAWRDRRDSGIDVVTLDRGLAVQCKNHATGTPVSWRHYATFSAMSEAVGMGDAKCLWTNPGTPIDGRVQAMVDMGRVALRREALGRCSRSSGSRTTPRRRRRRRPPAHPWRCGRTCPRSSRCSAAATWSGSSPAASASPTSTCTPSSSCGRAAGCSSSSRRATCSRRRARCCATAASSRTCRPAPTTAPGAPR